MQRNIPAKLAINDFERTDCIWAKKMGKKRGGTRRSSAAELLETPPLTPPPATDSPKSAIFNRKRNSIGCKFSSPENTNIAKNKVPAGLFKSSPRNASSLSSISDLKDFASSQLLDLKRHIDHSHSQIVKDLDSSNSRLQKRFKVSISLFLWFWRWMRVAACIFFFSSFFFFAISADYNP